jgi:chromosome segregation ATPase
MILKDRLNNNEKRKMENDIITKTTAKQDEYLQKEISDNNRKIRSMQNKLEDLQFEINRNEETLADGNKNTSNTQNLNENLDRQVITMKESIEITKNKIKNIQYEIENTQDYINEANLDNSQLVRKLNELSILLAGINDNNTKVCYGLIFSLILI